LFLWYKNVHTAIGIKKENFHPQRKIARNIIISSAKAAAAVWYMDFRYSVFKNSNDKNRSKNKMAILESLPSSYKL